ncbi:Hypothetical protein, putative [Bodo saltans]|uniref:Uncharacterized protein n=1 Tax=Bodo saltans TaxID=75058 RepID=A0A0S4JRJ9_BODSA|nr:Hypothetical protein, putative [Bodo saltans]|eukprot:CUG94135.1 Hypothetical protein, putative [Bodo saltans]
MHSVNFDPAVDSHGDAPPSSTNELIGRQDLLDLLGPSLHYIPFAVHEVDDVVNYFSHDFDSSRVHSATWVFFSVLSSELQPSQLAKLLIATVGVEPAIVMKTSNHRMFVNLKSRSDLKKVIRLNRTLLLDHHGAWFATDADGQSILTTHMKTFNRRCSTQSRLLPAACVSVDLCTKLIRRLLTAGSGMIGAEPPPPCSSDATHHHHFTNHLSLVQYRERVLKLGQRLLSMKSAGGTSVHQGGMSCCSVPPSATQWLAPGVFLGITLKPALKAAFL